LKRKKKNPSKSEMQRNKKNRKGKDKATNESDFPAVFGVTQVDFYVFLQRVSSSFSYLLLR
jgi:hypothetical protein